MSMIDISNLTFQYEGSYDPVFENVTFRMDTDWRLGFTGRNGRGKTTFMNLLMGRYEYSGKISSSVHVDYFPFQVDQEKMAYEIADDLVFDFELWKLQRELNLLEVNDEVLYRPFSTLSNGEQTKVMLAMLFMKENNFLLIDEPTNHLDSMGREVVAAYLKKKKGFILVSHDRDFLDECIDHILIINRTNIEVQQGNFSSWWYNKSVQDQYEQAENEKLKREISSLTKAAKQASDWSSKLEKTKRLDQNRDAGVKPDKGHIGHMAAKMMKRSKATEVRKERAVAEKETLLKNIEVLAPLSIQPVPYVKKRMVEAVSLSVSYDGRCIFDDLTFDVNEGERIAIRGKNGSGKSTILKLIAENNTTYSGTLRIGSNLTVSYVPQDISTLSGDLKSYAEMYDIDEGIFKSILHKMDFPRVQFEKNMEDFSDGQKKKVYLARSLCEKANLYVWDEPMNHIDIFTRMQIEALMEEYNPTMMFVEHDHAFCEMVATKVIEL